jgi:cardiolipin synthase
VFLYQADALFDIKKDMEETFALSEEITMEWCRKKFVKINVIGPVLKLFSPLL